MNFFFTQIEITKIELLVKNRNFGRKSNFWWKVEILVKNRIFGEKSKFWCKIEFWWKVKILVKKSNKRKIEISKHLFVKNRNNMFGTLAFTVDHFMATLATKGARFWFSINEFFSHDREIWFVSCQTEHDQIRIRPPNTMVRVWIVGWSVTLLSNVIDNFMFTLLSFKKTAYWKKNRIFWDFNFSLLKKTKLLKKCPIS